jgi:cyclic pyranopterin phosphate synthase
MDAFGRVIDYLRISVTDRCNERCQYCMPEGYTGWAQKADHLSGAEIVRIAEAACGIGFRKFRLTGGEPLLRHDIVEIAEGIWNLPGVETLGISTNGTLLERHAGGLKRAGVRALNVSLDALSPERYRRITGGDVARVLSGIEAALAEGFEVVKINTVLMRGVNEDELWPIVQFASGRGIPVRFIELMPVSSADVLERDRFLSVREAMDILGGFGSLEPLPDYRPGNGPARYYGHSAAAAKLGFIGAVTTPDFCGNCNKLRLTADGRLRPCLGRHGELDLRGVLRREGGGARSLQEALLEAIRNKPETHDFNACYEPGRPMTAIGG